MGRDKTILLFYPSILKEVKQIGKVYTMLL